MSHYTVFGGTGFIGSEFLKHLKNNNKSVWAPKRDDDSIFYRDLGVLIYCAGYGDCNKDPFNVVDANTNLLSKILKQANFEKIVYISSTRVYMNNETSTEDDDVKICYNDERSLFNLTKLASEQICLKSQRKYLIIRPSNVYGLALESNLFLPSITRNAINNKKVDMYVSPDYEKDYVSVIDVVNATMALIDKNICGEIVNIASGFNISAKELASKIEDKTSCDVIWHESNLREMFPITDISKLRRYIDFEPRNVLSDLDLLISEFKKRLT